MDSTESHLQRKSSVESNSKAGKSSVGGKPLMCRLCAKTVYNVNEVIYLYGAEGRNLNLLKKINACLPIKVQMTDNLPKQICKNCLEDLNSMMYYTLLCSAADRKLKILADKGHFSVDDLSRDVDSLKINRSEENKKWDDIRGNENKGKETQNKDSHSYGMCKKTDFLTWCPLCVDGEFFRCHKSPTVETTRPVEEQDEVRDGNKVQTTRIVKRGSEVVEMDPIASTIEEEEEDVEDDVEEKEDEEDDDDEREEDEETVTESNTGKEEIEGGEEDWSAGNAVMQEQNGAFMCHIRDHDYVEHSEFVKHRFSHAVDSLYHCPHCENYYDKAIELEEDIICTHKPQEQRESDVGIRCQNCKHIFESFIVLANHNCETMTPPSHKCIVCFKMFRSKARLQFHMKFHSGAKPGYCQMCKKSFPDEVKLYRHTIYSHGTGKNFLCDDCDKCFLRKDMLRNHINSNHKNMAQEASCFTCKMCFEGFPTTDAAVAHMDAKHREEFMDEPTYSFKMRTLIKVFICEYCERSFAERATLNKHKETHASEIRYECKYCLESFSSFRERYNHKMSHTDNEIPTEYSTQFAIPLAYLCEYCDRCFENFLKFSEHLTIHYRPEPYQCRFCNIRFKSLEEATVHRATHPESEPYEEFNYYRPYECHYCIKTFTLEDALVKHIRTHTGEKSFICDQCGKGFSQSSVLSTHRKVHSNLRPYACHLCSRTYKIKGDRDIHLRNHSGERPYKCELCEKAFMTQKVYRQHTKIHTGERPYKCDVCGKTFRRSYDLTVHKRTHTGEKPNLCEICGKRFKQKCGLLKHRHALHMVL